MTTTQSTYGLEPRIESLKQIEQAYNDLIKQLEDNRFEGSAVKIQLLKRKLYTVTERRIDLESANIK